LNNPAGVLLTKYTEPIENYGIPNIRVFDVADTRFSAQNPFYERILTEAESGKSYLEKVTETAHTFFSCWMGSNDVLLYAVSGGQVPITPPGTFSSLYTLLINNLMRNGAKGVVADIPSVTSIPFLTTLGPQVKSTLSQANIPGIFAQSGPSQNPTVIQVPTSSIASSTGGTVLFPLTASTYASLVGQRTGGYWREFAASQNRQLTEVLTQYNLDTTQAFGFHPRNPWPTSLILDAQEVATANTAVASFNQTIKTTADSKGLAFVDANALLQRFQTGSIYNGVGINAAFITGGLFSLDGVHLTPKGYAIAANEFIKATNARYGSTIPLVDVNNYPAVRFP
jgi:lysophospholipase L1-like esterase